MERREYQQKKYGKREKISDKKLCKNKNKHKKKRNGGNKKKK